MTMTGTDAPGQKFEVKYQRMKRFDVYAPPARREPDERLSDFPPWVA